MTLPTLDSNTIVPFLADIFERCGAEEYLGEAVSMAEPYASERLVRRASWSRAC